MAEADADRDRGRRLVREALDAIGVAIPSTDDAALEIDSFATVLLVEELEQRIGRRIPAREVRRERFASIAAIVDLVELLEAVRA
jgi:acyl carrier protein